MLLMLPGLRDRGAIRAFWASLSLLLAVAVGVLAAVVAGPAAAWAGVAVGALVLAPGLVAPDRVEIAYRAWDKGVRIFGRWASRYVARVTFLTVVLAAWDRRDRMGRRRPDPEGTMWRDRDGPARPDSGEIPVPDPVPGRWWRSVRVWGGTTGNRWAWALLPFLALLRLLDTRAGRSPGVPPPRETYTLY